MDRYKHSLWMSKLPNLDYSFQFWGNFWLVSKSSLKWVYLQEIARSGNFSMHEQSNSGHQILPFLQTKSHN